MSIMNNEAKKPGFFVKNIVSIEIVMKNIIISKSDT